MKVDVIVDPEDADLRCHAWHITHTANRHSSSVSKNVWSNGKQNRLSLSRLIVERDIGRKLKASEHVMHKNRNVLDCRRVNLCIVSPHCISKYRGKFRTHNGRPVTSRYRGVYWHKMHLKWVATIKLAGCRKHLGYFTDETAAARAYDKAARDFFGRYAYQNFPEEARP